MKNKDLLLILKKLYKRYNEDEIASLGAQAAYYLLLSFFPFLIFFMTLLSYTKAIDENNLLFLSHFLPRSVYWLILDVITNILRTRKMAFISLGMLATVWSSSSSVLSFMYGMNKAYRKKETRPFWKIRGISMLFTIGTSILITSSIVLIVFGEIIGRQIFGMLYISDSLDIIWDLFRYLGVFITLFTVFILFFRYIPNCHPPVKKVIPGAAFSTICWIIISLGFSFYVNNFGNFSKTYGSIGAVIALLLWLYWSSITILMGSELNAILVNCKDK